MEQHGFILWFTGLSGAGKTTVAHLVQDELKARGLKVELLDGDVVRTHLSKGLGFSKEDRDTNIRRIGFVCQLLSRNGVVAMSAAISPYRAIRDEVRAEANDFVEVFVKVSLDEAIRRDVKGLYKKAIAGEIPQFTGVSDPYEEPENPELVLETERESPQESAQRVLALLETSGRIPSVARVG
jgi:adenylyl-sulfate kinase